MSTILRKALSELQAAKAAKMEELAPLQAELDSVLAKMAPLVEEERAVRAKIKLLLPPIADHDNQISVLARALGGKALSDAAAKAAE